MLRSFPLVTLISVSIALLPYARPTSDAPSDVDRRIESRFSTPGFNIQEAAASQQLQLSPHPHPNVLISPVRERHARKTKGKGGKSSGKGYETVNTLFAGVYPVLNVTWVGPKKNQDFVSFIDTGKRFFLFFV